MFRKKSQHSRKKNSKKDQNLLQQFGREIEDGIKNLEQKIEDKIADIGNEIERDIKVAAKKIKKKIDLFYKVSFFVLLTLSIILAYFVILVSTTPKSFPFVTQQIQEQLKKNYGNAVIFDDAYISFTRYGTLKVSVNNLKIFRKNHAKVEKQQFLIPKIEGEFSLLNILHSSFNPRKIKIYDPEIVVNDVWNSSNVASDSNPAELIVMALAQIKKEKLLTKSFEIENAKFIINSKDGSKEILVKKSQIRTFSKKDILYISSVNRMNFSNVRNDVELNTSCQLAQYNILKCDLFLVNFVANSISDLHPNLKSLEQVNAILNAGISFVLDSGKIHNVTFKADAAKGNFSFPEFFSERMNFSDLVLKGEYEEGLGILNLSEVKADFLLHNDADIAHPKSTTLKTHLDMSVLISNLKNWQHSRSDFYIKLHNAPTNELEKLWPVYLHDYGIREWVINHLKNGVVRDAYAKFSLVKNDAQNILEKIDSELIFDGLDLKYEEDFPEITKVNGSAKFTEKDMKIAITSGNVLGSRIYDSHVEIDNFNAPITMLKILGKSKGRASDALKHADNSPKFSAELEKYLNGDSQNDFNIQLPLEKHMALKHAYIAINSAISGLQNDYLKGAISASVKKDFGSENFVASLNLTSAELDLKSLSIDKKAGFEGGLNLIIAFPSAKKIELSNIALWKKEVVKTKDKTQIVDAEISGNISADTSPFLITGLNLKNENFGRNSYQIFYGTDNKTAAKKLIIRGQVLDLAPFIQNKFAGFFDDKKSSDSFSAQVALDNLLLANSKAVRNFYFGAKCIRQFCYSGALKGSYNKKQQSLSLQLSKKQGEEFARLEGQITDVGYLAEALGISNVVAGGNAHLKLQNKLVDKKPLLDGEITFDDSITIYENPAVKRLATNDLFSKVRDTIFSNDKTIFDSVKLEFALSDGILDLKSLIANNYKIGITAKGAFDLKNNSCQIKGMIVPGFIINNLFGIGNIPILGNVISGLLTGGEGGGLFGIRYEYSKKKGDKEATFETNKVSSFVPTTIKNLFDLI